MGIFIAALVVLLWTVHSLLGLFVYAFEAGNFLSYLPVVVETYLYTGLFITAHDAMHGSISKKKWVNRLFGRMALVLFAAFSFQKVQKKHFAHHRHPGTEEDPDFDSKSQNPFLWFFRFFFRYVSPVQILIMAACFQVLYWWLGVPLPNLILYWVLPAFLSTFQLFFFGTYLPHRKPHDYATEPHRSRTQKSQHLLAMLSCYFFGYHLEHHISPGTPWWRLWKAKELCEKGQLGNGRV